MNLLSMELRNRKIRRQKRVKPHTVRNWLGPRLCDRTKKDQRDALFRKVRIPPPLPQVNTSKASHVMRDPPIHIKRRGSSRDLLWLTEHCVSEFILKACNCDRRVTFVLRGAASCSQPLARTSPRIAPSCLNSSLCSGIQM